MDGNTALGASSPAKPALHMPEPLSMTSAAISSSMAICTETPRRQRSPPRAPRPSPGGAPLPPHHPPSSRGRVTVGNRRPPGSAAAPRGCALRRAPPCAPAGAGAADADLGRSTGRQRPALRGSAGEHPGGRAGHGGALGPAASARGAGRLPANAGETEQRKDTQRKPAAECETDHGLPRRYLSGSGPRAPAEARAAPEHVHIWRSFQKPGAYWPARQGHVGPGARPPLARASANRPARAAPACSRPGRGAGLRGSRPSGVRAIGPALPRYCSREGPGCAPKLPGPRGPRPELG